LVRAEAGFAEPSPFQPSDRQQSDEQRIDPAVDDDRERDRY
jgi:hypothetical protein